MGIFYIGIFKPVGPKNSICLAEASDLGSFGFFERSSASQFMSFFAETVSARTEKGQRQSVEEGNYMGHVYVRPEGIAGVLITDKAYSIRPAYGLLNKITDEFITSYPPTTFADISTKPAATQFSMPSLNNYLQRYQDPSQADAISRVQKELDETKIVLNKTIESVLHRGEKLDSLVDKSENLSSSSRMFYKQAKKTNSCCVIM